MANACKPENIIGTPTAAFKSTKIRNDVKE